MAHVELKELTKEFDDVVAVDHLDLDIHDKEFVVLLGPSGCGKTTTLRCLAGLEEPTSGEMYIGDRLVNDLEPRERNIAMVFQSYALYPHMTVYQNMAFPLQNVRMAEAEIVKRVNKVAKLLQIEKLLGRKPSQLSGGQRQRVALGRAIVREPEAFLMDEPLSNLDAKLRVYMRAELKKLQNDLGITTIYVTHDQVEAMTMADRIALLNKGLLQQYAPPKKVYDEPANQFVAGFIGSPPINFFAAELADGALLDMKEFQLDVPDAGKAAVTRATSKELIVGIRPQDVIVGVIPGPAGSIDMGVDTTEPMGDITILDLRLGDITLKAVVSPDNAVAEGQQVSVRFPPGKIHLFDRASGETLL